MWSCSLRRKVVFRELRCTRRGRVSAGTEKEEMAESDSNELVWVREPVVLFLFQRWPMSG
jgi:hypothetical protein